MQKAVVAVGKQEIVQIKEMENIWHQDSSSTSVMTMRENEKVTTERRNSTSALDAAIHLAKGTSTTLEDKLNNCLDLRIKSKKLECMLDKVNVSTSNQTLNSIQDKDFTKVTSQTSQSDLNQNKHLGKDLLGDKDLVSLEKATTTKPNVFLASKVGQETTSIDVSENLSDEQKTTGSNSMDQKTDSTKDTRRVTLTIQKISTRKQNDKTFKKIKMGKFATSDYDVASDCKWNYKVKTTKSESNGKTKEMGIESVLSNQNKTFTTEVDKESKSKLTSTTTKCNVIPESMLKIKEFPTPNNGAGFESTTKQSIALTAAKKAGSSKFIMSEMESVPRPKRNIVSKPVTMLTLNQFGGNVSETHKISSLNQGTELKGMTLSTRNQNTTSGIETVSNQVLRSKMETSISDYYLSSTNETPSISSNVITSVIETMEYPNHGITTDPNTISTFDEHMTGMKKVAMSEACSVPASPCVQNKIPKHSAGSNIGTISQFSVDLPPLSILSESVKTSSYFQMKSKSLPETVLDLTVCKPDQSVSENVTSLKSTPTSYLTSVTTSVKSKSEVNVEIGKEMSPTPLCYIKPSINTASISVSAVSSQSLSVSAVDMVSTVTSAITTQLTYPSAINTQSKLAIDMVITPSTTISLQSSSAIPMVSTPVSAIITRSTDRSAINTQTKLSTAIVTTLSSAIKTQSSTAIDIVSPSSSAISMQLSSAINMALTPSAEISMESSTAIDMVSTPSSAISMQSSSAIDMVSTPSSAISMHSSSAIDMVSTPSSAISMQSPSAFDMISTPSSEISMMSSSAIGMVSTSSFAFNTPSTSVMSMLPTSVIYAVSTISSAVIIAPPKSVIYVVPTSASTFGTGSTSPSVINTQSISAKNTMPISSLTFGTYSTSPSPLKTGLASATPIGTMSASGLVTVNVLESTSANGLKSTIVPEIDKLSKPSYEIDKLATTASKLCNVSTSGNGNKSTSVSRFEIISLKQQSLKSTESLPDTKSVLGITPVEKNTSQHMSHLASAVPSIQVSSGLNTDKTKLYTKISRAECSGNKPMGTDVPSKHPDGCRMSISDTKRTLSFNTESCLIEQNRSGQQSEGTFLNKELTNKEIQSVNDFELKDVEQKSSPQQNAKISLLNKDINKTRKQKTSGRYVLSLLRKRNTNPKKNKIQTCNKKQNVSRDRYKNLEKDFDKLPCYTARNQTNNSRILSVDTISNMSSNNSKNCNSSSETQINNTDIFPACQLSNMHSCNSTEKTVVSSPELIYMGSSGPLKRVSTENITTKFQNTSSSAQCISIKRRGLGLYHNNYKSIDNDLTQVYNENTPYHYIMNENDACNFGYDIQNNVRSVFPRKTGDGHQRKRSTDCKRNNIMGYEMNNSSVHDLNNYPKQRNVSTFDINKVYGSSDKYQTARNGTYDSERSMCDGTYYRKRAMYDGTGYKQSAMYDVTEYNRSTKSNATDFKERSMCNGTDYNQSVMFDRRDNNERSMFNGADYKQNAMCDRTDYSERAVCNGTAYQQSAVYDRKDCNERAMYHETAYKQSTMCDRTDYNGRAMYPGSEYKQSATCDETGFSGRAICNVTDYNERAVCYGTYHKQSAICNRTEDTLNNRPITCNQNFFGNHNDARNHSSASGAYVYNNKRQNACASSNQIPTVENKAAYVFQQTSKGTSHDTSNQRYTDIFRSESNSYRNNESSSLPQNSCQYDNRCNPSNGENAFRVEEVVTPYPWNTERKNQSFDRLPVSNGDLSISYNNKCSYSSGCNPTNNLIQYAPGSRYGNRQTLKFDQRPMVENNDIPSCYNAMMTNTVQCGAINETTTPIQSLERTCKEKYIADCNMCYQQENYLIASITRNLNKGSVLSQKMPLESNNGNILRKKHRMRKSVSADQNGKKYVLVQRKETCDRYKLHKYKNKNTLHENCESCKPCRRLQEKLKLAKLSGPG